MQALSGVYRPRQPKLSSFYRAIEEHFERFEQIYPESYEQEYGFWQIVIRDGHPQVPGLRRPAPGLRPAAVPEVR